MKTHLITLAIALLAFAAPQEEPSVTVSIVGLEEGTRLVAGMSIEVVATVSGDEIASVELFLDDISVGVRAEPPFTFTLGEFPPNSAHRLRAEAKTFGGLTAIDTRLFGEEKTSGYSVRVDLVTAYVTVTDAEGIYVRDLKQEDFVISEEGSPQEIAVFSSEITPLTAALCMDISSSMLGERIIRSQNAAIDLVRKIIRPEDRAMVLGFDHRLILYQGLSGDVHAIEAAIRRTGPNGGTALYDAVAGTTRKLFNLKGKRAIILLSDGDDTDSRFQSDEVLNYLQKSGVILYSVGLQTLTTAQTRIEETKKTIRVLQEMADFSGGQAYFPTFISHLPQIYAAIGRDLSSQYTLAYYPKNKVRDGTWRTITVSVKNRPGLTVRHRKGYFAE